jgi:hypothetical protein
MHRTMFLGIVRLDLLAVVGVRIASATGATPRALSP